MKHLSSTLTLLVVLLLSACSGSETYRGKWNATNMNGDPADITFDENHFTIADSSQNQTFEYTQNRINISNGVETYGITLDDGRYFQIHFPIGNDESKGAILDANGKPVYIISRGKPLTYEDLYGL